MYEMKRVFFLAKFAFLLSIHIVQMFDFIWCCFLNSCNVSNYLVWHR